MDEWDEFLEELGDEKRVVNFIMFDGRAKTGDTDRATVMNLAEDLDEVAEDNRTHQGEDYVWFECKEIEKDGKMQIVVGDKRLDLERHGIKGKRR